MRFAKIIFLDSPMSALLWIQISCIVVMICTCIMHFCNHYRFKKCCCCKQTSPTKRVLHKRTSSVLIYNNMNSNNCWCCQIDIKYKHILSKFTCIIPLDTKLKCYPLLFLLYLKVTVSVAISSILLLYADNNYRLESVIVYFIIFNSAWEMLLNFYRYYTTIDCIQNLSTEINSFKYYCRIFLRFSIYGLILLILCTFLFIIRYTENMIIIWWVLVISAISVYFVSNSYFIIKFSNILIDQYNATITGTI